MTRFYMTANLGFNELRTLSTLTKENSKGNLTFRFPIVSTLGHLSYFSTDFKIGFASSSAKGFLSLYSRI